jgi:hypothetical protein
VYNKPIDFGDFFPSKSQPVIVKVGTKSHQNRNG